MDHYIEEDFILYIKLNQVQQVSCEMAEMGTLESGPAGVM